MHRRWLIVAGSDGDARVLGFQRALRKAGYAAAQVVLYGDVLAGRVDWAAADAVRIESPGKDFETERLLIEAGGGERVEFEQGRIHNTRQWYQGFRRAMEQMPFTAMNAPGAVLKMFHKTGSLDRLEAHGVPTPRFVEDRFDNYEELRAAMGEGSVFVKLMHGSSASGAVAYRMLRGRHWAATTVERVGDKLYNSRRIRVLCDEREIAALIDALAPFDIYAERWVPKAGIDGHAFDVRVLCIRGKATHAVGRLSKSPMTNLHLRNPRVSAERIAAQVGTEAWGRILAAAEAAHACFPDSHYAGVDVVITPDHQTVKVLEVNAFGDLLPGLVDAAGRDTWESELAAWTW
ncbi:MAG: STM4014 family protein [Bryobacterales bacterium]|nr:STM4014 family protein [Bryobacterales bacterium]